MDTKDRLAMERDVITYTCHWLGRSGWALQSVFDGEERTKTTTTDEALDLVFSVDESSICFTKTLYVNGIPTCVGKTVLIVLGNDGYDCIADHSLSSGAAVGDDFEQVMSRVQDYCDTLADEAHNASITEQDRQEDARLFGSDYA